MNLNLFNGCIDRHLFQKLTNLYSDRLPVVRVFKVRAKSSNENVYLIFLSWLNESLWPRIFVARERTRSGIPVVGNKYKRLKAIPLLLISGETVRETRTTG